MKLVLEGLYLLCFLYMIVLFGRVVIDLVRAFARDWKPRGIVLVVCEAVYFLTDPPLRALRRVLPALRFGRVQLDLAFPVVLIATSILASILGAAAARA